MLVCKYKALTINEVSWRSPVVLTKPAHADMKSCNIRSRWSVNINTAKAYHIAWSDHVVVVTALVPSMVYQWETDHPMSSIEFRRLGVPSNDFMLSISLFGRVVHSFTPSSLSLPRSLSRRRECDQLTDGWCNDLVKASMLSWWADWKRQFHADFFGWWLPRQAVEFQTISHNNLLSKGCKKHYNIVHWCL